MYLINFFSEPCVALPTILHLKYWTRKGIALRWMSGHWDVFCELIIIFYFSFFLITDVALNLQAGQEYNLFNWITVQYISILLSPFYTYKNFITPVYQVYMYIKPYRIWNFMGNIFFSLVSSDHGKQSVKDIFASKFLHLIWEVKWWETKF